MNIPRPLTHEVKFPRCKYPVWQVSPMTDGERAEVAALLPVLERRLVPADPASAVKVLEDAINNGRPAGCEYNNINRLIDDLPSSPATPSDGSAAWIAALVAGYSLDTLRASIEFAGVSDLTALSEDLRRRRDNAIIYRYRCRVLLDLLPAEWYETPGAPCPEPKEKPFNHPVF